MKCNISNTDDTVCEVEVCKAKCCAAILPISQNEKNIILDYIKTYGIKPTNWNNNQNIFNQKFNNICPFLSNDYRCAIYPVRSDICRQYHCKSHISDFEFEGKEIVNFYTEFFPELKVLYVPDLTGQNKIFEEEKKRRREKKR